MFLSSIFSDQDILDLRSKRSLVLVSGGRDSVFLLHAFAQLKEKFSDVNFEVLHFNHNLRGIESDRDQSFVEDLCRRLNVICHIESLQFPNKSDLQNAARNKRRQFALLKAAHIKAQRAVMAHHADDQLETLVMRTRRGAGISGLCGMRRHSHFNLKRTRVEIFRPMLHLYRDAIDDFFAKTGEKFREDASNQSQDYLRNRVRQQILQFWTDQKSKQTVLKNAEDLQACVDYLQQRVQMLLQLYSMRMPRPVWDKLPDELQFMWLRALVARSGFKQQFERKHVVNFLQGETCSMTLGACRLMRDQSVVRVCSQRDLDFIQNYQQQISKPGSWYMGVFDLKLSLTSNQTLHVAEQVLDVSTLEFPLHVRAPKPGDQFVPKGKSTSRKIGDFFQAKGIGRFERLFCPIIADSKGQILVID